MGLSLGCMTKVMYQSPNAGDIMQRGPNMPAWTVTTDGGRRLGVEEFKKTLKMPLTEMEVLSITRSWKPISQNLTNTGCSILLRSVGRFIRGRA